MEKCFYIQWWNVKNNCSNLYFFIDLIYVDVFIFFHCEILIFLYFYIQFFCKVSAAKWTCCLHFIALQVVTCKVAHGDKIHISYLWYRHILTNQCLSWMGKGKDVVTACGFLHISSKSDQRLEAVMPYMRTTIKKNIYIIKTEADCHCLWSCSELICCPTHFYLKINV